MSQLSRATGLDAVRAIPLTVKVPMVVVTLMVAVSVVVSDRVMNQLIEVQERHLDDLGNAYLDGLAATLVPPVVRGDIWQVFDIIDRSPATFQTVKPVLTIVTDANGRVLAATDPFLAPSLEPLPDAYRSAPGAMTVDETSGKATVARPLTAGGRQVGGILTVLDIAALLAERSRVIALLIVTNIALTVALAAIGTLAIARLIAPMRVLTEHLSTGAASAPALIADAKVAAAGREGQRLLAAYNALVRAERSRRHLEARLADEERLAGLGRLASGMAHDINNPLGGMFNALDTLKRHGARADVRAGSTALLERGLNGIRDVVRATLHIYRPSRDDSPFGIRDVEDVAVLARPQIERGQVEASWSVALDKDVQIRGSLVRLALLNLVLNAIAASGEGGRIAIDVATSVDGEAHWLELSVSDSGAGLPPQAAATLTNADAAAPIGKGEGLGLWMVRRTMSDCGGSIELGTSPLGGARITLRLPHAHTSNEAVREAA